MSYYFKINKLKKREENIFLHSEEKNSHNTEKKKKSK